MASTVRLLEVPFAPGTELDRFVAAHPLAGGIASFVGQVRGGGEGEDAVLELELSQYAPLTEPGMQALADLAAARWALDGVMMLHRIGTMAVGEPIVLVAAAARHRREAFLAVDFAMDHLKSAAWLWKRERTAAGWRWIEPRAGDYADRERW